ncbi:hypothetical protein SRHO_G00294820 [Serrasalmus rhombeus]
MHVAVALYKLGSCAEYRVISNQFGIHKSTVKKFVYLFCKGMIQSPIKQLIKVPNEVETLELVRRFEAISRIPQIMGLIDGTHIPVLPTTDGYRDCVNRKGWPSYVLQGVVDDKGCCKMSGSAHDATVLHQSELFQKAHLLPKGVKNIEGEEVRLLVVGDPAYPSLDWLIKGYTNSPNVTPEQESFNVYLSSLRASYFPQDHTGEHIAEALQDALTSWKLNLTALVAITTDNRAKVVKAVQLNSWMRMQCFGHRLHLAIGHGMDDARITRAISLFKKVVSTFSYSWRKRRELAEVQMQLGLPSHQLITETTTRWGSRLLMIERVLEHERALSKVLSADMMIGEEYGTLSCVRPVLHLFNTSLLAPGEEDGELCKSIKTSIVNYLNNRYADPSTSDFLDIASFVDPQFRAKYIQTVPESVDRREAAVAHTAKKKRSLASFFQQSTTTSTTFTQREAIENEFSSYLLSVCLESDADPLKWWKEHEVANQH